MNFTFWCLDRTKDGYILRPYLSLYDEMSVLYRRKGCIDNRVEIE